MSATRIGSICLQEQSSFALFLRLIEKALNAQLSRSGFVLSTVPFCEVAGVYNELVHASQEVTTANAERLTFRLPRFTTLDFTGCNRVRELVSYILYWAQKYKDFVHHVVIHGSLASRDFTYFSDVDILLVLADDVLYDGRRFADARHALMRLNREILKYDPLQHHGLHVIPSALLEKYPTDYLPVSVFERAIVHSARDDEDFCLVPVHASRENRSGSLSRMSRSLSKVTKPPATAYDAKLFLSSLMLLPALALQAEGHTISKRDSFKELATRFASDDWEPMAWATRVRDEWPRFELSRIERTALKICNPWLVSRTLLMQRPLPEFLVREWTPRRHASLIKFVQRIVHSVKVSAEANGDLA